MAGIFDLETPAKRDGVKETYLLGMQCAYKVNIAISCAIAYFANASLLPLVDSFSAFATKHIAQFNVSSMPDMSPLISKVSELFSIYVNVPLVPLVVISVASIGLLVLMYQKMKKSDALYEKTYDTLTKLATKG